MAGAGYFPELLGDGGPLAEYESGKSDLVQLLVKGKLAGKKAAVKSGESKFQIVRIESAGFLDRPGAGAGPESDVPHALDD